MNCITKVVAAFPSCFYWYNLLFTGHVLDNKSKEKLTSMSDLKNTFNLCAIL